MPEKIVIDTDIGDDIDDAIALSFAVRWPEVDVLAVTTSHVCTRKRGRMAARQLSLLGADHIPYAAGLTRPMWPMEDERVQRILERQPMGYAFVGDEEEVTPPATERAVDLIHDRIQAHPGEVTLVTIGALTNAADLLRVHPEAAGKLKAIAMMAGDFPGDKREYNVCCDPEAARMVFAARLPKFLGTWEVTRRVVMLENEVNALRDSDDPACGGLVEQIELWRPHRGQKPGPVIYDMCPILWAARPDFFTTSEHSLDVVLDGPERGRCVENDCGDPIRVSVDMRHQDALALMMKALLGA